MEKVFGVTGTSFLSSPFLHPLLLAVGDATELQRYRG